MIELVIPMSFQLQCRALNQCMPSRIKSERSHAQNKEDDGFVSHFNWKHLKLIFTGVCASLKLPKCINFAECSSDVSFHELATVEGYKVMSIGKRHSQ